jgi:hypothetical protein
MILSKKNFLTPVWRKDFNGKAFANKTISLSIPEESLGVADDKSITYKYNSDSFRSEEFKKEHDGTHILFAGCSSTFGTACKYEDVWAKLVYEEISLTKKLSGYFNLGLAGASVDAIYKDILIYISKYSKPDFIFMLLPDPYRYFKYLDEVEKWYLTGCLENKDKVIDDAWGRRFGKQTAVSLTQGTETKNIKEIEKSKSFLSKEKVRDLQFHYLYQIQNIEMVCRAFEIKLIWSTWHIDSAKSIKNSQIYDNFISITEENEVLDYLNNVIEKTDTSFILRDGIHHGTEYHKYWSKKFLDKFNEMTT